MVLDTKQYDALARDNSYIDFLNFIFTHQRCLFIGFSFLDPAIENILKTIAAKSIVASKTHHALLPESAPESLAQKLAEVGVRVERYSSRDRHSVLWDGIANAASLTTTPQAPAAPSPPSRNKTKHFVAISYAVAQLEKDEETALTDLVLQGVVLSSMEKAEASLADVSKALKSVVPMDAAEAEGVAQRLLNTMETRGLITTIETDETLWKPNRDRSTVADPIEALTESFRNRLLVRESLELSDSDLAQVGEIIRSALLERSWELAQDFMAGAPREEQEDRLLLDVLKEAANNRFPRLGADRREAIVRTIINLFAEPDPAQESILSDLIRLSFGVQVVTAAGRTTLYDLILPERLFLDSNILMPFVIEGHPISQAIGKSIRKLRRTAGTLSLIVADVFLNEVISHRNLALREYKDLELDKKEQSELYADYFGPMGTNAFIAGYLNRPEGQHDTSFADWLATVAPYQTESALAQWLRGRDFGVVYTAPSSASEIRELGEMELSLDGAYEIIEDRRDPAYRKPDVLKDHEAKVLRRIRGDLKRGTRSYLVTDDKKLRNAVHLSGMQDIEDNVISHVGLIQLIDLTIGNKFDPHILNTTVWSMRSVDDKLYLRNYLVSRIQKNYDAAMLLSMPRLLDAFVDRAAREANLESVQIRPSRDMDKGRTVRFARRIESEFYAEMAKEVKKIKEQLR